VDQEVAKTLGELELKLQELERELTSIGRRDGQAEPPKAPGTLIDEAVERESPTGVQPDDTEHASVTGDSGQSPSADAGLDGDGFGGPAVYGGEEIPAQAGATVERDWTVEIRETAYGEIPTPPSPPSQPPSPPQPSPGTPPGPTPQPPPPSPPQPSPGPTPQPPPSSPPEPAPPVAPPEPRPPTAPPGLYHPSRPGVYPPSSPSGPPPPDPRRSDAVEESRAVDLAELVRFRDKLARTMDELIDEYSRLLPTEPHPRRHPGA
jgi:hypothetical protein